MVKRIDVHQLIQAIDTPVDKNPLVVLQMIQAYDDEDEPPMIVDEDPEPKNALTEAFFNKIDKEFCTVKRTASDLSES